MKNTNEGQDPRSGFFFTHDGAIEVVHGDVSMTFRLEPNELVVLANSIIDLAMALLNETSVVDAMRINQPPAGNA